MTFSVTSVFSLYVQVQDCIEQNNELRTMLNQLRLEQSSVTAPTDAEPSDLVDPHAGDGSPGYKAALDSWKAERTKLKVTLSAIFMKVIALNDSICLQDALSFLFDFLS